MHSGFLHLPFLPIPLEEHHLKDPSKDAEVCYQHPRAGPVINQKTRSLTPGPAQLSRQPLLREPWQAWKTKPPCHAGGRSGSPCHCYRWTPRRQREEGVCVLQHSLLQDLVLPGPGIEMVLMVVTAPAEGVSANAHTALVGANSCSKWEVTIAPGPHQVHHLFLYSCEFRSFFFTYLNHFFKR